LVEKQYAICFAGETTNEGLFSGLKGESHFQLAPDFLSGTYSLTSSTMSMRDSMSETMVDEDIGE